MPRPLPYLLQWRETQQQPLDAHATLELDGHFGIGGSDVAGSDDALAEGGVADRVAHPQRGARDGGLVPFDDRRGCLPVAPVGTLGRETA